MSVRYYALVPSEEGDRVLVVNEGGGNWAPPSVRPRKPHSADVFPVSQMLRNRLGLGVPVLRCLGHQRATDGTGVLLYLTEPVRAASRLAEGARWLPPEQAAGDGAVGRALRPLIAAWTAGRMESDPEARPPWAHSGWFHDAVTWIRAELRSQGLKGRIRIEQRRSWSISTVLRVRTTQGALFFKALPWYFASEPAVTQVLGGRHGGSVPDVVAIEVDRAWMLSRDFGGRRLDDFRRSSAWEAALRSFGRLQIHEAPHASSWLQMGLPDRRLSTLEGLMEPALAGAVARSGGQDGWILDRLPELTARLRELRAGPVPDSLVHGDFHAGNIRRRGSRTVFFDWTDACLAHPFLDMATLLFEVPMGISNPAARQRLRRAYLEPWEGFGGAAELEALLEHALILGIVHTLVSYEQILDSMEPASRWELEGAVPFWLGRLAALLRAGGER